MSVGNFLGFLVHQRGIEVDKNKENAIIENKSPNNKKRQLHRLLGQINFFYCVGKTKSVSSLMKLKDDEEFV